MRFQELTGTEYLKADIACKYDKAYEKATWDDRIQAFEEMDLDDSSIYKTASNPIGLRAAIMNYKHAQRGDAIGYMISLDAASSGLQLLSLLVSCKKSWSLCGGNENIRDAYTFLYDQMEIHDKLDRKDVKQSIMTALYGSVATPKAIFKEDITIFYDTLEQLAPGAWDLNMGIQELWGEIQGTTYDWTLPDNFYCCIETTEKQIINFKFLDKDFEIIKKVNERPKFHKGLGPNLIHSIDGMIVREMFRRCQFDPKVTTRVMGLIFNDSANGTNGKSAQMVQTLWDRYKESGFLSTRILNYLYEDTIGLVDKMTIAKLLQTFPEEPFQLVSVHDCFRCHPNYGNDLRRQYNHILADINESSILQDMASQVAKKRIPVNKVNIINRYDILHANYTLS